MRRVRVKNAEWDASDTNCTKMKLKQRSGQSLSKMVSAERLVTVVRDWSIPRLSKGHRAFLFSESLAFGADVGEGTGAWWRAPLRGTL